MPTTLLEGPLTKSIIGAFYEVYNGLGYGYLEHAYVLALERELLLRGHRVAREVPMMIRYKGADLLPYRLDMVVDERVIVEAKSTDALHPSSHRQLLSYLKGTGLEVGLLLHFGPEARFHRLVFTHTR